MSDKPSYLGLLNAIALAERRAGEIFRAWRDATSDRELAEVLEVVRIREQEHAAAFTKRLCELGYSVRETPSDEFEPTLALARSEASDREKFRQVLGYGGSDRDDDPLRRLFDDSTIDPQTGALLGRFIAEERDTERRLRAAWERVRTAEADAAPAATEDPILADITARIDRLAQTIEELKALRR